LLRERATGHETTYAIANHTARMIALTIVAMIIAERQFSIVIALPERA